MVTPHGIRRTINTATLATVLLGLATVSPTVAVAPRPIGASGELSANVTADDDALAGVARHGPRQDRTVAITIDDGYDSATCRRMARTLVAEGEVATFFPIVKNVRADPRTWRHIARRFPLANHTMFHGILPPLPAWRIRKQITAATRTLERITKMPALPYLRPPGGAHDDRVRRIARRVGIETLVMWDTTAADTGLRSSLSGMLRSAMKARPGSIVLMHCNRALSARLLPRMIAGYRERGFRLVTIPELLGLRQPALGTSRAQQPGPRSD